MPRRVRSPWALPAAAIVAIVAATVVPDALSAGASTPDLPTVTPVELITKAQTAQPAGVSGTVEITSHLGLPDLGSLGGLSSNQLTQFVSGSHDIDVWIADADHQRVALAAPLAETDWIRNGDDVWSWDSSTQRVVHANLADANGTTGSGDPVESAHASDPSDGTDVGEAATPAAAARHILDAIDPSTRVDVRSPRMVAGRAAYELAVEPRSTTSTIGEAVVSIDAATGVPLDVRVTAVGATSPSFEVGFTSVSLGAPDPSHFAFTAPPGSTTVEAQSPLELLSPGGQRGAHEDRPQASGRGAETSPTPSGATPDRRVTMVGEDWDTVAIISGVTIPRQAQRFLDGATPVSAGSVGGRLVSTPLVNVLLLDDGRIAVGAVTVDALTAAVAGH